MRIKICVFVIFFCTLGCSSESTEDIVVQDQDYSANVSNWVDREFQPSTLTREEQISELTWFTEAAAPYRGMTINVVSETLTTHEYESEILTNAFLRLRGSK